MIAPTADRAAERGGLGPAFAAVRARLALVALLFALAAVGWWWTARPDAGDGQRTVDRSRLVRLVPRRLGRDDGGDDVPVGRADGRAVLAHDAATIAAVAAALRGGLSPHVGGRRSRRVRASARSSTRSRATLLAWDRAGRWVAGATLVVAAVYELTPLKDVCLGKCRSPLGFLLGSWRDGRVGALQMGAKNGAWCVGCCWALMASLFALGIMSITWMAVVAGLIALEKTLPWRRVAAVRDGRGPPRPRRAGARRALRHPRSHHSRAGPHEPDADHGLTSAAGAGGTIR